VSARILAVLAKDLEELRRSRLILSTLVVPSLLYVALPLWLLAGGLAGDLLGPNALTPRELELLRASLPQLRGLPVDRVVEAFLVNQVLVLYMLAPLFIPLTIASYSIIGEKGTRSLEPLLATPIRTWELLVAKALAAVIPGLLVTWASYLLFALGARALVGEWLFGFMTAPTWLLAFALVAPLFALLAVGLAVVASSRTNDPRAAQQLGAVVILPVSGLLFAQVFGLVLLDARLMVLVAGLALLADLGLLWAAVRLFDREAILTRWR
jgi:ABC-2 type transport system permease protein